MRIDGSIWGKGGKQLKTAVLAAALLAAPISAPASAQDLGGLLGAFGLGGETPITLSPRVYGQPVPVQLWVRPSPGPDGHLRVDGRARAEKAKAHLERGLARALAQETRGALQIQSVRLSRLTADGRAFAFSGEIRHAAREGAPVQKSPFEARAPFAVAPEGLKIRPEGRIDQAPPALRAAFGRLLEPTDLVAQEPFVGARLLSFTPSVSADGALEARAAFLASPQALAGFWSLALGGGGR